jgi:hypothetical protein
MYDRWKWIFFQQTIGISMGTKCAPLLAHLLHYSFEADAMQGLLKTKISELDPRCNFFCHMLRYGADVVASLVSFI